MPIFTSDLTSRGIIYADTITTNSNEDLTLNPAGTGSVVANARLKVNEISADDSTSVSIKSPLQLDSTLQVVGNLTVDANTLFVNSSNNRVGIGTTSPAYQVEIENTGANALLVLDRTDGAACFIEGQATRSAFGSVGATPLALAYNSAAVVTIGESGAITVNPDGDGYTFPTTDGSANQFLITDGSGTVSFGDLPGDISVNQISAKDSSAVSITSPLQTTTVQSSGAITANSFVTGTLTVSDGQITDTDGTISFNNINLDGINQATITEVITNIIQSSDSTSVRINDGLQVDGPADVGGFFSILNSTQVNAILDQDDLSSDSDTALATQQSIKAYVDSKITTNLWEAVTNNDIDSAVETVDSWDASTYRCAVYHYEISNTGLNEYQSGSLNVLHDGTSAQVTDYAFMTTGNNALVTFSVDIDAGNVRLRASAQAPNSVLNAKRLLVGKAENITWALVENTDVDSATESLDSWSISSYRSAVYHYQITNSDTSEYQSGSINILHNGSAAQIQEYGVLRTGNNDLITFSVTVSGGNVVLQGSANTPNSQFKAQRMLNGS